MIYSRQQYRRNATTGIRFLAICAAALLAWTGLAAPTAASPKKLSYETYRLVRTRNIFDPDRRAMAITQVSSSAITKPLTRSDYIALTGAMITDDSALAFFSGSRPEYNKVLPVKSSIVGATIVKITAESVVVSRDGKEITVAVGQTVPFDNSAPTTAPAATPESSSSASSGSAPTSSGSAAPSTNVSEVMRRMMERRQQELK